MIFQREILDWLLPIWTLPSVCEIHDKMQVVYKELRRDLIKFKVAKSEFYLWKKKSKRERIAWKIYYQRHLVPSEFFQRGRTMRLEHVIKYRLFTWK